MCIRDRPNGATYQAELAACQRYAYQLTYGATASTSEMIGLGTWYNATIFRAPMRFPVPMRINPTLTATTGTNYYAIVGVGATASYNSITLDYTTQNAANLNITTVGGTGGQSAWMVVNTSGASILFSAEL